MAKKLSVFDADSPLGQGPFVTDGTASGTFLLKDVLTRFPGNSNTTLTGFGAVGSARAVFAATTAATPNSLGLYVTDGTVAGTVLLKPIGVPVNKNFQAVALGSGTAVVQLSTYNSTAGNTGATPVPTDIWVTDGTTAGTVLVKSIPYLGSFFATGLTSLGNGRAVFTVPDTLNSSQLWVTDGTTAGTVAISTVSAGIYGADKMTPLGNGTALFNTAQQVWATNGTAAGTVKIADLIVSNYAAIGTSRAVFFGYTALASKTGLYVSDGTAGGTSLLQVVDYHAFTPVFSIGNGRAVFARITDKYVTGLPPAAEIYVTDGTTAGTKLLISIPNAAAQLATDFTPLGNGSFLFNANTLATGGELWISDGTTAGTMLVKDIQPGPNGSDPLNITAIGDGYAVFVANSFASGANTGNELYVTNGTAAGTALVRDINPGPVGSAPNAFLTLSPATAVPFVFSITPLDASKPDGTGNTTPYTFTMTRTGDLSAAATVSYSAAGSGSNPAPPGLIVNPVGTVTFAAGSATTVLTINLQGATITTTETFAVTLGGAPVGSASATATGTVLPTVPEPNLDKLFDAVFYLARNPDVLAAKVDAYLHYLTTGWKEGRDPSALFSTSYYLSHNPDVAKSGLNPLLQFEQSGFKEGRDPSGAFSVTNYLAANPDVKAAGVNALLHYVTSGQAEGRKAIAPSSAPTDPGVDATAYYAANPDVRNAAIDPATHYHASGWHEGRNPNGWFDTNFYLTQNPDVKAAGIDPLTHFETTGWKEGRDPSLVFSDAQYLAVNPDVRAAGLNPLLHYLSSGRSEGRVAFLPGGKAIADPLVDAAYYDKQLGATLLPTGVAAAQQAAASYDAVGWQRGLNPNAFFNTAYYLSHNPDVAAAKIDPLLHYEANGWREGRDPSATFSTAKYLAAYADVKAAGLNPLAHFLVNGQAEGRTAFSA